MLISKLFWPVLYSVKNCPLELVILNRLMTREGALTVSAETEIKPDANAKTIVPIDSFAKIKLRFRRMVCEF